MYIYIYIYIYVYIYIYIYIYIYVPLHNSAEVDRPPPLALLLLTDETTKQFRYGEGTTTRSGHA